MASNMYEPLVASSVLKSEPLVLAIAPAYIKQYCNNCLTNIVALGKARKVCSTCKFAHYCSALCAQADWSMHKLECAYLKGRLSTYSELNDIESMVDVDVTALLTLRLFLMHKAGTLATATGKHSGKTFATLVAHADHFQKSTELDAVRDSLVLLLCDDPPIDPALFIEIFAKLKINSLAISAWSPDGTTLKLGIQLHLDYAGYDHSCVPNVQPIQSGRNVFVVPFLDADGRPIVDAHDFAAARIDYIDVATSLGIRQAMLSHNWHFKCTCARCVGEDGMASAMHCTKCRAPIGLNDVAVRRTVDARFRSMLDTTRHRVVDAFIVQWPKVLDYLLDQDLLATKYYGSGVHKSVTCGACGERQTPDDVEYAYALMSLIGILVFTNVELGLTPKAEATTLFRLNFECEQALAPCNIFVATLRQAMGGADADPKRSATRLLEAYNAVSRLLPRGHRSSFQHALPTLRALVMAAMFDEATKLCGETEAAVRAYFGSEHRVVCPFGDELRSLRVAIDSGTEAEEKRALKLVVAEQDDATETDE